MDVAFIAVIEAGTVQWGQRQLWGFRGILSDGPGPGPEGSLALMESAVEFRRT